MENYENNTTEYGTEETENRKGNKAGVTALIAGGALAIGGLAVAGVKKLKSKKEDKPAKKQKTKYKWIKVAVDDIVEEQETIEEVAEEETK